MGAHQLSAAPCRTTGAGTAIPHGPPGSTSWGTTACTTTMWPSSLSEAPPPTGTGLLSSQEVDVRTLVLNAGYEPLAVVSFRRALVLVLAGKASVVLADADPSSAPR